MADYRPLVIIAGLIQQLDDSDTLYVGNLSIAGFDLPSPTADNQILQATGADSAAWTTDIQSLTSLAVDNITVDGATIASDTGEILLDDDNLYSTGKGRFDSGVGVGSYPLSITSIYATKTYTGTSGGWYGINAAVYSDPAGTSTATVVGAQVTARTASGNANRYAGYFYGGYFTSVHQGSGQLDDAWGGVFLAANGSVGSLINGICGRFPAITNTGGGTISRCYGIYLGEQVEGSTVNWQIYSEGGNWHTGADDSKIYFGTGDDASFYYDGTDMYCNPKEVGSGEFKVLGSADISDSLTVAGIDITAPETGNTPSITGADKTIYVDASGDDTNGDGTSGDPYETIARALLDCYKMVPSGDDKDAEYTITISVAAGHYTVGSAVLPTYGYGAALKVTGEYQDCDASTATSYGSDTALSSGLSYIDISGVLASGTTASVGDYLVVTEATGGTNPHLVEGCHEITAWNSGTRAYTSRVVRRSGVSAVPSGTITLTSAYVAKTIMSFASGNGIKLAGAYFGGIWDGICLVGNTSGYGVWCVNSGSIQFGSHFATSGWLINIYAQNQANIFADYTCHSYSNNALVSAQNGAVVNLRYGVPLTGARKYGIKAFIGATIAAYQVRLSTCGSTAAINCTKGAFVDAEDCLIQDPYATCVYANADVGGGVELTGATVSGGATATSSTNGFVVGP